MQVFPVLLRELLLVSCPNLPLLAGQVPGMKHLLSGALEWLSIERLVQFQERCLFQGKLLLQGKLFLQGRLTLGRRFTF